MTRHRLDNRSWGFESSCFVCDEGNEDGLRIPFFHDDEKGAVVAEYTLGPAFSGTPRYLHGGVTLAVLDEAMAWAAIALARSFAVTRSTTTRFRRPVKVGTPCRVEARLAGRNEDGTLDLTAVVLDERGRTCAEARAEFVPMSAKRAQAAIGPLSGGDGEFVKG